MNLARLAIATIAFHNALIVAITVAQNDGGPTASQQAANLQIDLKDREAESLEQSIVQNWKQYSKAFEYADYTQIADHFALPVTMIDSSGKADILETRKSFISKYRDIRSKVQDGYKYSLLRNHHFRQLAEDVCLLEASYQRFNSSYQPIYNGRGVYFYRKIDSEWRIYTIMQLPSDPSPSSSAAHVIQVETHYYTTGPQQGRPADGKFPSGTRIKLLKVSGNYSLVESDDGIVAYVSSDSLKPLNQP